MKAKTILKTLGIIFGVYVVLVFLFETVYLRMMQPSFETEDGGIPMINIEVLRDGTPKTSMLAKITINDAIYVSAHHWTRQWYSDALENPCIRAEFDGVWRDYKAHQVLGEEFDMLDAKVPLPTFVLFLMGFPPERDIIRLDPVEDGQVCT